MLKYLFDTNICIFIIRKRPQEVQEVFERHHDRMCISTVTLMGLIYDAGKSSSPERNLLDVERFATRLEVIKYDEDTAAHTG